MAHLVNGIYYLGDPCYVFENDAWDAVVDGIIDKEGVPFIATVGQSRGYIWSHGTAYGDGSYEGSDGKFYDVDSGNIGLVAQQLISDPAGIGAGRMIEAYWGLNVDYIDGRFIIAVLDDEGKIQETIQITTDDWEDEDEHDPDLDLDTDDDL